MRLALGKMSSNPTQKGGNANQFIAEEALHHTNPTPNLKRIDVKRQKAQL